MYIIITIIIIGSVTIIIIGKVSIMITFNVLIINQLKFSCTLTLGRPASPVEAWS